MRSVRILMLVLIASCNLFLLWRLSQDGLDLVQYRPQLRYEVALEMTADVQPCVMIGEAAVMRCLFLLWRAYLPVSNNSQTVIREWTETTGLSYQPIKQPGGIQGRFTSAGNLHGHHQASYHAIVEIREERYRIPSETQLPESLPQEVRPYLFAEDHIQSDHPEVRAASGEACASVLGPDVGATVQACFHYVSGTLFKTAPMKIV